MNTIKTDKLTKFYGKHLGIQDVSLDVKQGEVFGFIGPNGAGKSTMIRTMLGLLVPTSGTASIFGKDAFTEGHEVRKRVGYLPSEVNYYDEMTPKELLEYSSRFYENGHASNIPELAERFELDLTKKITDLSFGNKKKVGIIQAVIHKPDLLVLDEPTSGLDPVIKNRFFELLEQENERGATIFFSSHILSEIQRMCDRAAVIQKGKIVAIEDLQNLLKKQMKKVTLVYTTVPDSPSFPEGVQKEKWHKNKVSFEYLGPVNILLDWMTAQDLIDAVLEEPDLETIFMNYYQR